MVIFCKPIGRRPNSALVLRHDQPLRPRRMLTLPGRLEAEGSATALTMVRSCITSTTLILAQCIGTSMTLSIGPSVVR